MLDPDVLAALAGSPFGDVRVVDETGSTNADVLALARAGEPEGVVVVADHQRAGRGRLDRRWEAPAGSSLLVSVLTRPVTGPLGLSPDSLHRVTTAMGIAAAEAAEAVAGVPARLKWPNDLVVERDAETRKLSGILAETHLAGRAVEALVVGIGINVNWPEVLPPELADTATALNLEAGRPVDRAALLVAMLERFAHWYLRLGGSSGAGALLGRYRELSATLGRRVRVETPGGTIEGDAFDLTTDGHLLVVDECPDRPREISVGDVIHLRLG